MVHLFGVRYAQELEGMDLEAIAKLAGRPPSMGAEIRKGRALALYVTERPNIRTPLLDSTNVAREVRELRSEVDDYKRDTKSIFQSILSLLDRADVLSESYPPASMTISELKRAIREL